MIFSKNPNNCVFSHHTKMLFLSSLPTHIHFFLLLLTSYLTLLVSPAHHGLADGTHDINVPVLAPRNATLLGRTQLAAGIRHALFKARRRHLLHKLLKRRRLNLLLHVGDHLRLLLRRQIVRNLR